MMQLCEYMRECTQNESWGSQGGQCCQRCGARFPWSALSTGWTSDCCGTWPQRGLQRCLHGIYSSPAGAVAITVTASIAALMQRHLAGTPGALSVSTVLYSGATTAVQWLWWCATVLAVAMVCDLRLADYHQSQFVHKVAFSSTVCLHTFA